MTDGHSACGAPSSPPPVLVEFWRGDCIESVHRGSVVVARADGSIEAAWGDPTRVILPRSSVKILQALPLVETGAADAARVSTEELALACASHQGAPMHTERVAAWLARLGLREAQLLCGSQVPDDSATRFALRTQGTAPRQLHNACSGKHAGFLTLTAHLGAGPDYVDPNHPVQDLVRDTTETLADETSGAVAIDGCSAPTFALSLRGLATATARMADPSAAIPQVRRDASARLRAAMQAHPLLVAGERRVNSALLVSAAGRAVAKSGAEGIYVAMLPEAGLGVALKMEDGASRGSHAVIAGILTKLGALAQDDPLVRAHVGAPLHTRRGVACGRIALAADLMPN